MLSFRTVRFRTDEELAMLNDLFMILVSSSPIVKFCYLCQAVKGFSITIAKVIKRCSLRWHFRCKWLKWSIGYLGTIRATGSLQLIQTGQRA